MPPNWYQTMARRDTETVAAYAEWLGTIPWQLFATFTFAWRISDAQADEDFKAFINLLELENRSPIGFVRGDEKRRASCSVSESGRHYHVLLTSHLFLDQQMITRIWREYAGSGNSQDSARVDPYDAKLGGAEYCLKMINETEGDWKFRNLDLFLPGYEPAKSNTRSRRRAARNQGRASTAI